MPTIYIDKITQIMSQIVADGNLYRRKDVLYQAKKVGLDYRTTCRRFLRPEMRTSTRGVYNITLYVDPKTKTKSKKDSKTVVERRMKQ